MRWLRHCLFVLTRAVVVLGAGSTIPRLVLSGEGVGAYSGKKRAFARFAPVYGTELREWPFPIDPTVARRVTEVNGTHDRHSPCNSEEGPRKGPYYTGHFRGDYKAEGVRYGPFSVPTGKNVFDCDIASTYLFLLPRDAEGAALNVLESTILLAGLGPVIATVVVPVFLTLGGSFLLVRSSEGDYQTVGLAALVSGIGSLVAASL